MTLRADIRHLKALFAIVLTVAVGAALTRAQSKEFYAKRAELQKQAQAARQAAGLDGSANMKKLYAAHPTPEITFKAPIVMASGASVAVSFGGKFSDQTTFLSGSDALTLSDAVVGPNSFKATATAAAGAGPQWARVYAIAPVSAAEDWAPIFIGAPQAFTLAAKNGWTIKLTPEAKQFRVTETEASAAYKAEYFKAGAQTPFETTTGSLSLHASNTEATSYTFMMQSGNQGSAMAEMERLTQRMAELMKAGKLEGKEMADIQKKMEVVQERMMKEMQAQIADPAAMQRKQDDFGCGSIFLYPKAGGITTGSISCGKNVGSSLEVTAK